MNKVNLKKRSETLSKLVVQTASIYHHEQTGEGEKGLLETIIGAGIWYLPSGVELYSGFASRALVEALENDPVNTRVVEEHSFPRKLAGAMLLEKDNVEKLKTEEGYLENSYLNRFGRYNLVLKSENDRLKKFQKKGVFENEEKAYQDAGITLVPFGKEKYLQYKKRKSSGKNSG